MALTQQKLLRQLATSKSCPSTMCVRGGLEGPIQREQLPRGDCETREREQKGSGAKVAGLVWAVLRHPQKRGCRDVAALTAEADLRRRTLPAAE